MDNMFLPNQDDITIDDVLAIYPDSTVETAPMDCAAEHEVAVAQEVGKLQPLSCPDCKGVALWLTEECRVQCACGFHIPTTIARNELSQDEIWRLLHSKSLAPLPGYHSKSGKHFIAGLKLTKRGLQYVFPTAEELKQLDLTGQDEDLCVFDDDNWQYDTIASTLRVTVSLFNALPGDVATPNEKVYQVDPSTVACYRVDIHGLEQHAVRALVHEVMNMPLGTKQPDLTRDRWGLALVNAIARHPNWVLNTRLKVAAALRWHFRGQLLISTTSPPWKELDRLMADLENRQKELLAEDRAYSSKKIKSHMDLKYPFEVLFLNLKPKTFKEADLLTILQELSFLHNNATPGKKIKDTPRMVHACLEATIVTGLRTCEWKTARWADASKSHLITQNAKHKLDTPAFLRAAKELAATQGLQLDANGEWRPEADLAKDSDVDECRTRLIPVLTQRDREIVDLQLALFQAEVACPDILDDEKRAVLEDARFQKLRKKCQQYLRRLCRRLWPDDPSKHHTIYDGRGQFSANMRSLHGNEKAAELMGHKSITTPSAGSYGRRSQAHAAFKSDRPGPLLEFKNSQKNAQKNAAVVPPTPKVADNAVGEQPPDDAINDNLDSEGDSTSYVRPRMSS